MRSSIRRYFSIPALVAAATIVVGASCEPEPTKSNYVSAQVSKECRNKKGQALQLCRLVVIKKFKDVPFEEIKRRYPAPEPRRRSACSADG